MLKKISIASKKVEKSIQDNHVWSKNGENTYKKVIQKCIRHQNMENGNFNFSKWCQEHKRCFKAPITIQVNDKKVFEDEGFLIQYVCGLLEHLRLLNTNLPWMWWSWQNDFGEFCYMFQKYNLKVLDSQWRHWSHCNVLYKCIPYMFNQI